MPISEQRIDSPDMGALDAAVRRLMTEIIFSSAKSREQIAEEMSPLVGRRISAHMINCFTASCKEQHRFPAAWIEAFCLVTGDDRLNLLVMGPRYRRLVEYAERELAAFANELARKSLRDELLARK